MSEYGELQVSGYLNQAKVEPIILVDGRWWKESEVGQLVEFTKLLAKPARWISVEIVDDVYLGTQLGGVSNDATPTVGECREAARFLGLNDGTQDDE